MRAGADPTREVGGPPLLFRAQVEVTYMRIPTGSRPNGWRWGAVLVLALLHQVDAVAQAPPMAAADPFTVEDVLDVVSVDVADLSADGMWLAVIGRSLRDRIGIDNYRFGDPTYAAPAVVDLQVIDSRTGASRRVFGSKQDVRGVRWSPDGTRLAVIIRAGEHFQPLVWSREDRRTRSLVLPEGRSVAMSARGDVQIDWSPDGTKLLLALQSADWRRAASAEFQELTRGPITVLSDEPLLRWDALRDASSIRSLVWIGLQDGRVDEVLPESRVLSYSLSRAGDVLTYSEGLVTKTSYARDRSPEGRLMRVDLAAGHSSVLIESTKGLRLVWSGDGRSYAYSKEGDVFVGSVDAAEPRLLIRATEADSADADSGPSGAPAGEPRRTVLSLSPDGERLVASSKEGLWLIRTTDGQRTLFLESNEDDESLPAYQVVDWAADGAALFLAFQSRTAWQQGVVRYDVETGRLRELVKDGRQYSSFRLSTDGSTFAFSLADPNRPSDVHVAGVDFEDIRKVTEGNPSLAGKAVSRAELIRYRDVDGKKLHGVLYYPAGYEPGRTYPTVFIVYEGFFDARFNGTLNLLTSNGYAVVQPSVDLEIGYPGEAWLKGVTAAANEVIDMGVADEDRLGVHGTSYGGYATNLLITQTNRFKAAINISGKVNMVSFYTDSPRLGIRNIHAPENSQDRIGATLWEQPQKYIAHSAIMYADRIKTPLLVLTGEQDHNVPGRQGMEIYYALRRLGGTVEWVNYVNGGHGMPTSTEEEVRDYHERILAWYGKYLIPGSRDLAGSN